MHKIQIEMMYAALTLGLRIQTGFLKLDLFNYREAWLQVLIRSAVGKSNLFFLFFFFQREMVSR